MDIPRHWRLKAQRYRLEGSTCPYCNQSIFPPRPVCPHCKTQLMKTAGKEIQMLSMFIDFVEPHLRYRIIERLIE